MTPLAEKSEKLKSMIRELGSALVAFSGGVDSALVLAVAREALGDKALAVTARSESLPQRELNAAGELARELGAEHLVIETEETLSPDYLKNPVNRCYHCKSELYSKLSKLAEEKNLSYVLNGVNRDDLGDHRPGIDAAHEAGVLSPLAETGFTKQDVRDLARQMGLPNWEKPAMACLSSRVPYGEPITAEKLSMIERAEDLLLSLGFTQLRVRHHGEVARIELPREDIPKFFTGSIPDTVETRFKKIGFRFVTVDIEGFRSGRMNEGIIKHRHPSTSSGRQ
ncbi:MAG: ATP-dependent sacrificial sulfur transferase LarE [Nitrospinaceae bacterium]